VAVLIWKHGKPKPEAVAAIRTALKESGHDGSVKWDGTKLEARSGPFASIVHVKAEVTDDALILEKCGGLAGGRVLSRCRELLERLFPGGEQPLADAPTALATGG
jgi:hypothetical protein